MTLWDAPQITEDMGIEELREIVARLVKDVDFIINGNIDSKNAREIGGWSVGLKELVSKDGDVGMSTEDTSEDDIRFFAGAPGGLKELAPWRVTKSGKEFSTGATIQSAAGYPKIVMDPESNLLAAYSDADSYLAILPDRNGVPALVLVDGDETRAFLNRTAVGGTTLGTFDGEALNLQASGALSLQPSGPVQINGKTGWTGNINYVKSVSGGELGLSVSYGTIYVEKGIITSAT